MTVTVKKVGRSLVIGPVRLSYVHLFERYKPEGSTDEGKYTCTLLIPRTETAAIKAIEAAIGEAKKEGVEKKWNHIEPRRLDTPLRDGEEKLESGGEAYRDCVYLSAKGKSRPGVVIRDKITHELTPISDPDDVYSGMWAYVSVNFYPYSFAGNNGIGVGLNNVMKYKDDDRLGSGRTSAESDFADYGDVSDEDL